MSIHLVRNTIAMNDYEGLMEQYISPKYLTKILRRSMIDEIIPAYIALQEIRNIVMDDSMNYPDISKYIEIKNLLINRGESINDFYKR